MVEPQDGREQGPGGSGGVKEGMAVQWGEGGIVFGSEQARSRR